MKKDQPERLSRSSQSVGEVPRRTALARLAGK